jgi:hypothetical protein
VVQGPTNRVAGRELKPPDRCSNRGYRSKIWRPTRSERLRAHRKVLARDSPKTRRPAEVACETSEHEVEELEPGDERLVLLLDAGAF